MPAVLLALVLGTAGAFHPEPCPLANPPNRRTLDNQPLPPGHFQGAPPGEATEAYLKKAKHICQLTELLAERVERFTEHSPEWLFGARKIDEIYDSLRGSSTEPLARMLLLECIEIAATLVRATPAQRTIFIKNSHQVEGWSQSFADIRAHRDFIAAFSANSGKSREYLKRIRTPWSAPEGYVSYDFHSREPAFYWALGEDKAREKLRSCIAVWHVRGRPKAGQPGNKWGLVQELMALIGLEGATAETLEAEWREHRRERGFDPQKILFEKARLPASVFFFRGGRHNKAMATNPRIPPLTDTERARLMREVRARGEHGASVAIGVARQTLTRALARLHLQSGSVLLIRTGLAALNQPASAPPSAA